MFRVLERPLQLRGHQAVDAMGTFGVLRNALWDLPVALLEHVASAEDRKAVHELYRLGGINALCLHTLCQLAIRSDAVRDGQADHCEAADPDAVIS